jgi:hypothetical protein
MPWYIPPIIAKILFYIIALGVPIDDVVIWNTKRFTSRPALLKSEYNNIATFRKYCQKFQINNNQSLCVDW